jgi:putative transposase
VGRLTHRTAAGFTYFVTTKTWENRDLFRVLENAEILVECLMRYREKGAYLLHEFVVMPNHLHLLLTPSDETSLERAMQFIKGGSSHEIHKQRGHKMQIWQAGFHESTIRDHQDFASRQQYIRVNPLEARLVSRPEDWAYGSASGRFTLDLQPMRLSSGAKARFNTETGIVGAKAPTP